ncbi:MAG TPA: replication initiator protein A [Lactovum miscens]|uniref:replication initiator protein A n=1 Tax=Lactovum miscens TaxID=190387 RepID=UPI002EDAE749
MSDITIEQLETSEIYYKLPKLFLTSQVKTYNEKNEMTGLKITTSDYAEMSNDAKLAYGVLYDRLQLSIKNARNGNYHWVDKDGAVYLEYSVADLQATLNCGNQKAIKLKKELIKKGLLREVHRGVNRTNLLYLQNIDPTRKCEYHISSQEQLEHLKCENHIPRNVNITFQEVWKSHTIKTDYIKDDDDKNNKEFQKIWSSYKKVFLASEHDAVHETDAMLSLENLFTQKGAALLNEALKRTITQTQEVGLVRRPISYMITIFDKWQSMKLKTIEEVNYKDPYVETI